MLEISDKLARDAFVHSVKVFTSLVLFYAFIINYNKTATAMADEDGAEEPWGRGTCQMFHVS